MKGRFMKTFLMALAILGAVQASEASETLGEKTQATAHDMKRSMKKAGHRMSESVCAKSDTKCFAEKSKHRASEAGDYTSDKAREIKNDVDRE
jgi:hypothetical protein